MTPTFSASPSAPTSTSETGNKPPSGPAADAPKAQGAASSQDYTNPLMQNQVLDPHVVTMMAGQRWYSKVYDPPLYPETGAVRDFVVRHGGDVADSVSLGGSILWGGATLGTGWFAGEAITAGGRLTIDGAMDGDPESIVKGAIKLAEGVMEAADIDVSEAIGDLLDDTPAPGGDVLGGGVEIKLKRPAGVSDEAWQRKMDALNAAAKSGQARVVHNPVRSGAAQRRARAEGKIAPGDDADHGLDLQFGGADNSSNIMSTQPRVNRSVGAQGQQRMQHRDGTPIDRFKEE